MTSSAADVAHSAQDEEKVNRPERRATRRMGRSRRTWLTLVKLLVLLLEVLKGNEINL
ncbi:MAG: hypothetical protein GTO14_16900 [Anaerolineales bacterium]|nr:hypothetical protein [Anaerolineales bacterium]